MDGKARRETEWNWSPNGILGMVVLCNVLAMEITKGWNNALLELVNEKEAKQ